MKHYFLFLLPVIILFSVETKAQAYTYHPFPDSGIVWQGYTFCGAMGNSSFFHWTINIIGDTLVSGISYHKIDAYSALREDSNKRVYFLELYSTPQEHLLYDFSFDVGDTMTSWYFHDKLVVMSVDTPQYWGVPRRTLHITDSIHFGVEIDRWIEGIGSSSGPTGYEVEGFCNYRFLCSAWVNNSLVYGDGNFSGQCSYFISIETIHLETIVLLSPNPSTTSFTLQLSSPPTTQNYFLLFDALGREVKSEEIVSATTTIHRNNLPNGIYFWQIQSENKVLDRGKLIFE